MRWIYYYSRTQKNLYQSDPAHPFFISLLFFLCWIISTCHPSIIRCRVSPRKPTHSDTAINSIEMIECVDQSIPFFDIILRKNPPWANAFSNILLGIAKKFSYQSLEAIEIISRSMFFTRCYEQSIGHVKAPVYWTASTFQSIQLLFFNQITSNRSISNVFE